MKNREEKRRSIDIDDVAAAMGVSRGLVYKQAAEGTLPFPCFRVGKRFVIPREPFERVMTGLDAVA